MKNQVIALCALFYGFLSYAPPGPHVEPSSPKAIALRPATRSGSFESETVRVACMGIYPEAFMSAPTSNQIPASQDPKPNSDQKPS